MNKIFSDDLDKYIVVYLGDTLVYSEDPSLHLNHVRNILQKL